jgi:hypothetical protein
MLVRRSHDTQVHKVEDAEVAWKWVDTRMGKPLFNASKSQVYIPEIDAWARIGDYILWRPIGIFEIYTADQFYFFYEEG